MTPRGLRERLDSQLDEILADLREVGAEVALTPADRRLVVAEVAQRIDCAVASLVERDLRACVLARDRLLAEWPVLDELLRHLGRRDLVLEVPLDSVQADLVLDHPCDAADAEPIVAWLLEGQGSMPGASDIWSGPDEDDGVVRDEHWYAREYAQVPTVLAVAGGQVDGYAAVLVYRVEQEVRMGLHYEAIALDASRYSYWLARAWGRLPKDPRVPHEARVTAGDDLVLAEDGKLKIVAPRPASEDERQALRDWRSHFGLAHYMAFVALLARHGRTGTVRWSLREHAAAMGYRPRSLESRDLKRRVARLTEAYTRLRIVVEDAQERRSLPVLTVLESTERRLGGRWRLEGLRLQVNPLLYEGVRAADGKVGRKWLPLPPGVTSTPPSRRATLAQVLAVVVGIRLRWRADERATELRVRGRDLAETAGFDERRRARSWRRIERALDDLTQLDPPLLQGWRWASAGEAWTLEGILVVRIADWIGDRIVRRARPVEPRAHRPPDLRTGRELRSWRRARGLSQVAVARYLGVSERTVSRAESGADRPLPPSVRHHLPRLAEAERTTTA